MAVRDRLGVTGDHDDPHAGSSTRRDHVARRLAVLVERGRELRPFAQDIAADHAEDGAGDLLEIEKTDGRKSLIPFRDGVSELRDGRVVADPIFLA